MEQSQHMLQQLFGISQDIIEKVKQAEATVEQEFKELDKIKEFNQYKVLRAMQESRLSDQHFQWTTGYGYNDLGREKLEEVYSRVFGGQDAIVRPTIVNGTHALTLCLSGLLKPGDEMISVTGKPYDTLDELIGIRGNYPLSLKKLGVIYNQIDFLDNGEVDFKEIEATINKKTTLVYIQRSTGYGFRKAVDIATIERIVNIAKAKNANIICMVDNCYGEFLETKEPTEVGADLIAGSLIKNPGGGLALAGGYIVGNKDLIELISYRMTSPGIGKECGLTFGTSRSMFHGLFIAPHVVCEAIKGAIFCAKLFSDAGYRVMPNYNHKRSDIIQAIELADEGKVLAFCKGIQEAAPVDSFVKPEPWDMPGYDVPVIMAAGAFVQGSSIELSADAPIKPPYIVYYQGGLTYEHAKLGAIKALQNIVNLSEGN
ncbi:methionine gamma-lyase family protein [Alkaliphilus peptidifermentans]|uniref:Cystathionine beta-lyase family protein involved in aluminum resistance n=1 Tax=Alkaliphilus peptidifermentans DSM 18978 TaxID=1120976 RepID=A0A1G5KLG0_9FIRM|nr:methionine gamma-lyase family protein [Alkaliphilus peptidifermentans]SCZ01051.1 Cystathionine beta-lyase family protein involved in aluminum resistance [Alkaliphilus peptidifermentans DSM 18978]